MKKLRLEKNHPTTTSVSQKRGSLNQEQLFVPYKVDWRAPSPINSENNNPSKVFFQDMKAELSTIKNDFQKLIRKEINLKIEDEPLKPINGNKIKNYSSARKDMRSASENEKMQFMLRNKDPEEHCTRIFNLQKNLPCSSGADIKQALVKTLNVRENKQTTSQFNTAQVRSPVASPNRTARNNEISSLREKIMQYETQLFKSKGAIQAVQESTKKIYQQKTVLQGRVSELSEQLSIKNNSVKQKNNQIVQLNQKLSIISEQAYQLNIISQNWNNQRNFLNQHLSELSFHHDQLRMAHQQIFNQNNQLRETVGGLQRFCEDLQHRCADIENDWKRKLDYLQKDLQSYQQREDMFSSQIQHLKKQIISGKPFQQKQSTQSLNSETELQQQIAQLKNQIYHLNRQVSIEKDLHENLAQKCIEKVSVTNNMEQISHNFQATIAQLLDQNGKLKNKANLAEAKMQSLALQNKSYLEQIHLYQQRQQFQKNHKQLNATEWESMAQQIQQLKEKNRKLTEEISQQQFAKQYQSSYSVGGISQDLIKLSFDQRNQIEGLKQNIKSLTQANKTLTSQIQGYRSDTIRMQSGMGNNNNLHLKDISKKENQIKLLKQLIFSVIVEKIRKSQDQQELQYYMKQLQSLKTTMIV